MVKSIYLRESYTGDNTFVFLNREKDFSSNIDWNFHEYGRLWTYNLNYFDYLLQPALDPETGLRLIMDFIDNRHNAKTGYEPYPTSLRTVNWIKFCTFNNIHNDKIDSSLYAQFVILSKNIEYHLLANHLFENAVSLMFGAYYFRDDTFYTKARKLLTAQLDEQIMSDGAHFELSPMYHKIILYRLLDSYNLIVNNDWRDDAGLSLLIKNKVEQMLGWLKSITFRNGEIPHLNDSSDGIAPDMTDLEKYAHTLNISSSAVRLSASGYRKFETPLYECICDAGQIGPDYQPGHAHADTFSFVMNIHNRPVIVDTGCSTYEWGRLRSDERGTASHNTVTVNAGNSSEIWGSHRVARRAKVTILDETGHSIEASHDGYKHLGCTHIRRFTQTAANIFTIADTVAGNGDKTVNHAYLHFSPYEDFTVNQNIITGKDYYIELKGAVSITVQTCHTASGFNMRTPSRCVQILFYTALIINIYCNENTVYNG
jgi:hypothetical protein